MIEVPLNGVFLSGMRSIFAVQPCCLAPPLIPHPLTPAAGGGRRSPYSCRCARPWSSFRFCLTMASFELKRPTRSYYNLIDHHADGLTLEDLHAEGLAADTSKHLASRKFFSLFGEKDSQPKPKRLATKWPRWRQLILSGSIFTTVVLAVNIGLLAGAANSQKINGPSGGTGDALALYGGSCNTASRIFTGLHLLINGFATIMFTTSTACIQILLAPSREDIDQLHAQRRWCHVGIINWRNIKLIPRRRACLAAMLVISSFPLHLL